MDVPHKAPDCEAVLARAREARSARDAAELEWHAARDALRAAANAGNLPRALRAEVESLLHEDESQYHRRWRPSPS